jgi:hypothetical protein
MPITNAKNIMIVLYIHTHKYMEMKMYTNVGLVEETKEGGNECKKDIHHIFKGTTYKDTC